jgi:hypothetical protein
MDEKMYPIKGLEGFYSITKSGRVFSLPRNPKRNKNCYLTNEISISQNKEMGFSRLERGDFMADVAYLAALST